MNDTNSDDEFFDEAAPVSPRERGASFGLTAPCYSRMASMALRCRHYANVEPVTIARLRSGPGCQLTLYGSQNVYTLRVIADTSPARLMLNYLPLDSTLSGPGCALAAGYDQPQDWHALADLMIFREGTAGSDELVEWQELSEHLRESNDQWGNDWK